MCRCPKLTSPNFHINKSFLCGAETQLLDLKVHVPTAQGQSLVNTHSHSVSLTLLLAHIINSLCCDWLVLVPTMSCAGFDREVWTAGRQRALWDVEQISTCLRGCGLCSAVYHLTLHNWVHTSTKWRSLWRPTDMEGRVCQRRMSPYCPLSLWTETDKTDSSGSEGLRSSLPPYSVKHNGNW